MKHSLLIKLLLIHLTVIGFVMVIMWFSIDTLAAGYFVTLMEKYNISPEPAHGMFVESVHRYMLWATLAAVVLAVAASYLSLRRVLTPLTKMTGITDEIAAGRFSARVPAVTQDEVGRLARAFNRMAESLEKLENLRRSLMIDVAHELRTPLTNIRGYLEAFRDGVMAPSPERLDMLHGETLRLADLVEDVLQLARADAARKNLMQESVDLKELIRAAIEPFRPAFSEKTIALTLLAPESPVTVSADPARLARILRNLTDNAARYSAADDSVVIRIERTAEGMSVVYENAAVHVTPQDLPFLFERFYTAEHSRSRIHGGAGIGLAIVKELVEAHGGAVRADLAGGRIRIGFSLPVVPTDPPHPIAS